ncbi:MAG TPA: 50S ribosomal protein L24 [Candidatus Paceibacterota bacterium]|nr:50S ribosomal protein L24 [Candidatus Paceibacterota bacterium]
MKIRKNDQVKVMAGKDKGKTGKVLRVFPKKDLVLVDGVNMLKKHARPRKGGQKGQIIDLNTPIHISNVMLVEGGKAVRAGFKGQGDKKVRISRKSGKEL